MNDANYADMKKKAAGILNYTVPLLLYIIV